MSNFINFKGRWKKGNNNMYNLTLDEVIKSREKSQFFLSLLRTNMSYEKIDEVVHLSVLEILKAVQSKQDCPKEILDSITSYAKLNIRSEMKMINRILCKHVGLNQINICSRGHVNIGNTIFCGVCKERIVKKCTSSNCEQTNEICPHSVCSFEENCRNVESYPLHEQLVNQFFINQKNSGFMTREEHYNAIKSDSENDAISTAYSMNNFCSLRSLGEMQLVTLFNKHRPSPMDFKVIRPHTLTIPEFGCND